MAGGNDRKPQFQRRMVLLMAEFAGEEGVEMELGGLEDGVVAAAGDDAQGMDGPAGVDGESRAGVEACVHESRERGGRHGVGEESVEADGLSVVEEEGLSLLEVKEVCEDGVVADLGMEVEGEVHGVEGEAMGVECGEASCHVAVEALESAAPTDAVVDEEEVGVLGDGLVDGLLAGVDGEGDGLDVGGGLDLESVVGVVLVCESVEESAEEGGEVVEFHHGMVASRG